jgi:hypothetical protein
MVCLISAWNPIRRSSVQEQIRRSNIYTAQCEATETCSGQEVWAADGQLPEQESSACR